MNDIEKKTGDEEILYRLALHLLPGIGPVLTRNLVSYCGSVEEIFRVRRGLLEKIPGIGKERASRIIKNRSFQEAEDELKYMQKEGIRFLFYLDKNYPARLKNCYDAPVGLFYKGSANLNHDKMIAVVGTRHITSYGKEVTAQLIQELEHYNISVISGLAYGVDSAAHKEALKNNLPTIGVIAHGLHSIYPAEHRSLAQQMLETGGLITEYPARTKAEVDNFPARNRIVAGMSDAVIVIESAGRGGALITADLAQGYNRDVFAVPGRRGDMYSQGCNELIRSNKAALVQSGKDIAEGLNWTREKQNEKQKGIVQAELFVTLNENEIGILAQMKSGKKSLDAISIDSGLPVHTISSALLKLEFDGLVRALPGKMFELR